MYFRIIGLLLAVTILALPGCTDSTEEGTGTDTSTGEGADTDTGADASSSTGESSGASTGQSGDSAAVADAGSGAGEAEDYDPALRDRLLAGLGIPAEQVQGQLDTIIKAYRSSADSSENVTQYIGMISNIGMFQAQQENTEAAHEAFRVAAAALKQAQEDGVELMDPILAGYVLYNEACVLAGAGKNEEALSALEKSIEAGFGEMQQLDNDPDLQSVRELPEYAAKREAWQEALMAKMREQAKEELDNGQSFPFDFDLVNVVDGTPVALDQYAGKVCIVDIWGTWCGPCVMEIPSFVKLQEQYGSSGFQMIGLNSERGGNDDATKQMVASFIDDKGINYPCALISEEVQDAARVEAFPTTLFIDKAGKVRLKAVGLHEYEYLEAVVQLLMEEEMPQESTGD